MYRYFCQIFGIGCHLYFGSPGLQLEFVCRYYIRTKTDEVSIAETVERATQIYGVSVLVCALRNSTKNSLKASI